MCTAPHILQVGAGAVNPISWKQGIGLGKTLAAKYVTKEVILTDACGGYYRFCSSVGNRNKHYQARKTGTRLEEETKQKNENHSDQVGCLEKQSTTMHARNGIPSL